MGEQLKHGHDVPAGKKVNGFTNELEDAAPLHLAPSPADQRRLAAEQDDTPLLDKARERVQTDTARNVDEHYIAEQETPNENITQKPLVQHVDVPPTNTALVQAGHPVVLPERPKVSPSVVSPNAPQEDTETEATPTTENASESSTES